MLKQVIYIFKISVFVKKFKKFNPQDLKYKNIICKFYKLRYKYVHAFKKKKNGINVQKNSGSTETFENIRAWTDNKNTCVSVSQITQITVYETNHIGMG